MKFGTVRGTAGAVCAILLTGLLSGGCSTQSNNKQHFADLPPEEGQTQSTPAQPATPPIAVGTSTGVVVPPAAANSSVTPTGSTPEQARVETHPADAKSVATPGGPGDYSQYRLRVGDSLAVSYSDTPQPIMPADPKVNDDGKITLMHNQTFDAAGKTCSMLADEIRARYVPRYYVNITVTVVHMGQTQFFYVRGEIKAPARQVYTGPITVTQAIAACGDFTEFAKKTNVELIRVDGRKQKVDCLKAIKIPTLDPQVYPGDIIVVHRKIL